MTLIEQLKIFVFAVWSAINPKLAHMHDAPAIADAIAQAVLERADDAPVFGSHDEDAAMMAYLAVRESTLHLRAVGDGGEARGAFQLHEDAGDGDPLVQARAALRRLVDGRTECPRMPLAPYVGGCFAARRTAERVLRQERRILSLVVAASPSPALASQP